MWELVVLLPNVMLSTTMLSAHARTTLLVIHSLNVCQGHHQLSLLKLILAVQILVVKMQFVKREETQLLASVLPTTLAIPILNVSLNVKSTMTVPMTRLVCPNVAEIPAQDLVELVLIAELWDTTPFAAVLQVTPVTPWSHVDQPLQLNLWKQTLVILTLADLTVKSMNKSNIVSALVSQDTLATLPTVAQNVLSVLNVASLQPVLITSVSILALETFVVSMPDAKWSVTMLFANVLMDTLVIHLSDVLQDQSSNQSLRNQLTLAIPHLVDHMRIVLSDTETLLDVLANQDTLECRPIVGLNVSSMQTVPVIWHVHKRSVEILVLVLVPPTPTAKSLLIVPLVHVPLDTEVIPMDLDVDQFLLLKKPLILVIPPRVVTMQFVKSIDQSTGQPLVLVCQDTLEIHSCLAVQNVPKILIVQAPRCAKTKSVLILVQGFVALMQSVTYKTILLAVIACRDTLEILQWLATKYLLHQVSFSLRKVSSFQYLIGHFLFQSNL